MSAYPSPYKEVGLSAQSQNLEPGRRKKPRESVLPLGIVKGARRVRGRCAGRRVCPICDGNGGWWHVERRVSLGWRPCKSCSGTGLRRRRK